MNTTHSPVRTTNGPALARSQPCPSIDEIEDWLAEVRPALASLRNQARPPTRGARRWVLDQVEHAHHAELVMAHECFEAQATGRSCDSLDWVHMKVCAVLDAAQAVLTAEAPIAA